ncbi:MAG: glycosyltransferase family 4 protein [Pseudomonadota bacterium]
MKILFVVSSYFPEGAGSGRSVRNLAEGCAQEGHSVSVLRLSRDGKSFEETLNDVRIYHRPTRNLYRLGGAKQPAWKRLIWHALDLINPYAMWDFYQILKREKPDIVNTNVIAGFSAGIFLIPKLMGIKLVHTMRDYYLMCPQNAMFKNGKPCDGVCASCQPFRLVRKQCARTVDLFLSNSDAVANKHKDNNALPSHTKCITQLNMNDGDDIAEARRFPKNRKLVFGYIGRLAPSKGIEILLKAVQETELKDFTLKIAGQGNDTYVESLKQKVKTQDIEFTGQADAEEFYKSIDILICPSVYDEPLPRVIYEGYAHALPVIAARSGGIPEIVDHEQSGFLYAPFDAHQLANYMNDLGSNPKRYEAMSKNAAAKAQLFKKSVITNQFLGHLQKLQEAA